MSDDSVKIECVNNGYVHFRRNILGVPEMEYASLHWVATISDPSVLREIRDWLVANVKD